ncbi:uncharacterized protein LOC143203762 [Rhynchophorus ferrugineus]|uniref:uncharacterized protein LOC143203762 n=1 Tax=Rhynchophorus ferrugineus TaxID=354439 RepID=UPI003FCEAF88
MKNNVLDTTKKTRLRTKWALAVLILALFEIKYTKCIRTRKLFKEDKLYLTVYLDETWIFQNGSLGHSRQDSNIKSVKTTTIDGKRYMVIHAGNKNGFIPFISIFFQAQGRISWINEP